MLEVDSENKKAPPQSDGAFEPELTEKDELDISRRLDAMLSDLDKNNSALMSTANRSTMNRANSSYPLLKTLSAWRRSSINENTLRKSTERLQMTGTAIHRKADELVRRHESRNPAPDRRYLGINVVFEELGSINGLFNSIGSCKVHPYKFILPESRLLSAPHELGHAVLHPNESTHFMRKHTLFSVDRFEKEATYFASCLIIGDDDLDDCRHFTYEQVGKMFGVGEEIARLRVEGI